MHRHIVAVSHRHGNATDTSRLVTHHSDVGDGTRDQITAIAIISYSYIHALSGGIENELGSITYRVLGPSVPASVAVVASTEPKSAGATGLHTDIGDPHGLAGD